MSDKMKEIPVIPWIPLNQTNVFNTSEKLFGSASLQN